MALERKKPKAKKVKEEKKDIIAEVQEAKGMNGSKPKVVPTLVELNAQAKAGAIARKKLAEEK